MIRIYALSTCPWCKKLKHYLDEHRVSYECIDVDRLDPISRQETAAEVTRLAGERVFPVTVIGDVVVVGYQPEQVMEAMANET